MFRDGTSGCASRSTCSQFPSCGGRSGDFPIIFVLYLNIYPLKQYHYCHRFCLYNNSKLPDVTE